MEGGWEGWKRSSVSLKGHIESTEMRTNQIECGQIVFVMHMPVSQSNIHVGGKCDIYRLPKRRKWFRINFRLSVNTESTFKIYFNFTGPSAWLRAYLCPYFSSLAPKWLNRLFTRARYSGGIRPWP